MMTEVFDLENIMKFLIMKRSPLLSVRIANIDKYVGLVITLITMVQSVGFNLVQMVVEFKFGCYYVKENFLPINNKC